MAPCTCTAFSISKHYRYQNARLCSTKYCMIYWVEVMIDTCMVHGPGLHELEESLPWDKKASRVLESFNQSIYPSPSEMRTLTGWGEKHRALHTETLLEMFDAHNMPMPSVFPLIDAIYFNPCMVRAGCCWCSAGKGSLCVWGAAVLACIQWLASAWHLHV